MASIRQGLRRAASGMLLGALALVVIACSDDDTAPDPTTGGTEVTEVTVTDPTDSTDATGTTTRPTSAPPTTTAGYDFSAVAPIVERFVDERGLNGAGLVVVDRDDGIIDEEYWGDFGPDRVSLVASSSKMITAGVLLRLQDDGLLDIDAPVAAVADWGAGNPTITPAQLLSNSSGLVGLFPDPAYAPYVCQYLAPGTLQDCAASIFSTPDDDADVVAPDTEFRYGGAQWQVAGAVAEVASGKPWAQLIDEIYVQPCGLDDAGVQQPLHAARRGRRSTTRPPSPATRRRSSRPTTRTWRAASTSRPPDYAELLLMHLRGGRCGDAQVLSQAALDRMHADRIGPTYGADAGPGTGYGMGWWVDRASGRISDPGAYGSVPWLDLEDGYGAYLVIEADSTTGAELAQQLYDVVDEAVTGG